MDETYFDNMKVNEEVFRHEVLDTTTLNHFLSLKRDWDLCNANFNPLICGVFPANETPTENLDLIHNRQISWILNTDPSHKPGTHWVSILRNGKIVKTTENNDEAENCSKTVYYVVDSWGSKHTDKTCEHIIDTLENNFAIANFNHSSHMIANRLRCRCEFEINFPVTKRIQHATFENCGWYALQFSCMDEAELIKWTNSDLNDYGQIKPNYIGMVKFFTQTFFPLVLQRTPCVDYTDYKIKTINELPKCKINQQCCNHKFACSSYF